MKKSYYKILGLEEGSNKGEIKKAYRKLSQKYHPDKNGGDPFYDKMFITIKEAYEKLIRGETTYEVKEEEISLPKIKTFGVKTSRNKMFFKWETEGAEKVEIFFLGALFEPEETTGECVFDVNYSKYVFQEKIDYTLAASSAGGSTTKVVSHFYKGVKVKRFLINFLPLGRVTKRKYLALYPGTLFTFLLSSILTIKGLNNGNYEILGIIGYILFVVSSYALFALAVKRLHDTGKEANEWLFYTSIIPIGLLLTIYLLFASPEETVNRWGLNKNEEN